MTDQEVRKQVLLLHPERELARGVPSPVRGRVREGV
jgi:hypothetical protein